MVNIKRIIDSQKILPFEDYAHELVTRESPSIGRYAQYVGCGNHNIISAPALQRMLELLADQDFVVISANLDLDAVHENILRNRILRAEVYDWNMGVYQLVGRWTEAPEGTSHDEAERAGTLRRRVEKMYAIPSVGMSHDEFVKFLLSLNVIAYRAQDACLVHTGSERLFKLAVDAPGTALGYAIVETAGDEGFGGIVERFAARIAASRGVGGDYRFRFEGLEIPSNVHNRLMYKRHKIWHC